MKLMNLQRLLCMMICVLLVCSTTGCKKQEPVPPEEDLPNNAPCGYAYYSMKEIYIESPNVYIGTVTSIGKRTEITGASTELSLAGRIRTMDYDYITVNVQESFKGDFRPNQEIQDLIGASYHDFLKVGEVYLFMTGIDYFSKDSIYKSFNIYEAVKINSNDGIEVYRLDEYKKDATPPNHLPPPPKTLQESRWLFQEAERESETTYANSCVCELSADYKQSIRTDEFHDPYGLVCEKHKMDFRKSDKGEPLTGTE